MKWILVFVSLVGLTSCVKHVDFYLKNKSKRDVVVKFKLIKPYEELSKTDSSLVAKFRSDDRIRYLGKNLWRKLDQRLYTQVISDDSLSMIIPANTTVWLFTRHLYRGSNVHDPISHMTFINDGNKMELSFDDEGKPWRERMRGLPPLWVNPSSSYTFK